MGNYRHEIVMKNIQLKLTQQEWIKVITLLFLQTESDIIDLGKKLHVQFCEATE